MWDTAQTETPAPFVASRSPTFEGDLRRMAAESAGEYGSGVLTFQIVGAGCGHSLFRDAETGDATAQNLVRIYREYVEHTALGAPGAVQCLLCDGPFELCCVPWAVVLTCAAVPEPTVACTAGICTACCTALDVDALKQAILAAYRAVLPGLRNMPPVAEPGHA